SSVTAPCPAKIQKRPNAASQIRKLEGLFQNFQRTVNPGSFGESGYKDGLDSRPVLTNRFDYCIAAHARHHHVSQYQVDGAAILLRERNCFSTVGSFQHPVTESFKIGASHGPDSGFILGEQDRLMP